MPARIGPGNTLFSALYLPDRRPAGSYARSVADIGVTVGDGPAAGGSERLGGKLSITLPRLPRAIGRRCNVIERDARHTFESCVLFLQSLQRFLLVLQQLIRGNRADGPHLHDEAGLQETGMTKSDGIALVFLAVFVLALGWLRDKLRGYLRNRPSLRTRMYLQARKERKQQNREP